jgi:hypothetical protein
MRAELAVATLLLPVAAACSREAPPPVHPPETRAERLAALDRIAAECHVPRSMFILLGEDELGLRPRPEETYEHVDCVLRRVHEANIRLQHIGFVGNEVPTLDANNAQAH